MDNYTGRFGDALRRLTSLQAKQGVFAPQQMGGADVAAQSGFGASAPPMAAPTEAPSMEGFGAAPQPIETQEAPAQMSADMGGGFGGGSAQVPGMDEAGAMGAPAQGTSWSALVKKLTPAAKKQIADKIEEKAGGNLKGAYEKAATQNGDKPKKNASRSHMALYLGEVALRFAANRGTSESNGEALAKGTLQTDTRYAGMREAEAERARQTAETQRLETRADTKDAEVYTRGRNDADSDYSRNRADKVTDDAREHEQALELERLRATREKLQAKGKNTRVVVDDEGNYQLLDLDTQEVITPTKEVEEDIPAKGSRGQGTAGGGTRKVRKPVKALAKTNASGLDQDTVLRQTAAAVKEIKADGKTMRELRRKYKNDVEAIEQAVTEMARERVSGDVESLRGGGSVPGETNFSDLK